MNVPLVPVLLAGSLLSAIAPATAARSCLPYGPLEIALSGTLQSRPQPHAPEAEDVAAGDAPETGYYLQLPSAMCVAAATGQDGRRHDNVRELQLVLDAGQHAHLRQERGHTVRLTGILLEGRDRTTVRLQVRAIDAD